MGQFYSGGEVGAKSSIGAGDWLARLEQKHGLPAGILDAMWERESGRGRNMVSPSGATGHFQFMPGTARELGLSTEDTYDFAKSSTAAAEYLARLRKQNGGDLNRALAAYNWGPGNLDRKGMAAAPKETRDYVDAIGGRFTAPASQGIGATVSGEVKVKVDLTGVPPQAKVVTTSSGDVKTTVNVGRSSLGYALP